MVTFLGMGMAMVERMAQRVLAGGRQKFVP